MQIIKRTFFVLSAVATCDLVIYLISDNFYTISSNHPSVYPSRTDHDEMCDSSTSYDNLSVIPDYTRPIKMDTKWVCDLYREVKRLKGRQVTLLVCNKEYLGTLVNWLAQSILHAFQPVDSILIISFDSFTHRVLYSKGFHSVCILPSDVANSKNPRNVFAHIWLTRLTVIRLLNYWNYSVLEFDTDAIMMRNIQPLLDEFNTSDIIASPGHMPVDLLQKWSAPTMCMGMIFIKSSPATG